MATIFISPSRYVQGPGEMSRLGSYVEKLGKNTGMDEALGKLTYPAVFGLEVSGEKAREATAAAIGALERIRSDVIEGKDTVNPDTAVYYDFLKEMALDLLDRIS